MTKLVGKMTLSATMLMGAMAISWYASAQGYPDRPVELIVTFGPGGGPI